MKRGCHVKISVPLLFETIGLHHNDAIRVETAAIDNDCSGAQTLKLCLTGDDDRLPEVEDGQPLPEAQIICTRIESRFAVVKPPDEWYREMTERKNTV